MAAGDSPLNVYLRLTRALLTDAEHELSPREWAVLTDILYTLAQWKHRDAHNGVRTHREGAVTDAV